MPDFPKDLNWNRLAEDMTGNIRVGLAAGEAIARFDRPAGRRASSARLECGNGAGVRDGRVSSPRFG